MQHRLSARFFVASACLVVCLCLWAASNLRQDNLLECACGQPAVSSIPLPAPGTVSPPPDYVFMGEINSTCGCAGTIGRAVVNVVLPTHDQLALQSLGISVGKQMAQNQVTMANLDLATKNLPARFNLQIPAIEGALFSAKQQTRRIWLVYYGIGQP